MSIELKVKSYSLAEESKYIRKQENKSKQQVRWNEARQKDSSKARRTFWSLRNHRVEDIRPEARATFLARAYIKGAKRSTVEKNPTACSHVKRRAMKMIKKYNDRGLTIDFDKWYDEDS